MCYKWYNICDQDAQLEQYNFYHNNNQCLSLSLASSSADDASHGLNLDDVIAILNVSAGTAGSTVHLRLEPYVVPIFR
jgi:hypothetical protein